MYKSKPKASQGNALGGWRKNIHSMGGKLLSSTWRHKSLFLTFQLGPFQSQMPGKGGLQKEQGIPFYDLFLMVRCFRDPFTLRFTSGSKKAS